MLILPVLLGGRRQLVLRHLLPIDMGSQLIGTVTVVLWHHVYGVKIQFSKAH